MGALLNGQCFATQSEALDVSYSAMSPSYVSGATSFLAYFVKENGVWMVKRTSTALDGTVTQLNSTVAPVITFPDCDPLQQFQDGNTLGWGIACALLAAYCTVLVRKGL